MLLNRRSDRCRLPSERGMIRLELHRRGPRVHVFGRRVHECHLGLALLFVAAVWAFAVGDSLATGVLVVAGIWLAVKDWRDFFPSSRDTASWRLGIHRTASSLRAVRRLDELPALAAAGGLATG